MNRSNPSGSPPFSRSAAQKTLAHFDTKQSSIYPSNKSLGIWPVREEALLIGEKIQQSMGGELYQPWLNHDSSQLDFFKSCFRTRTHWILIMATGIAVRFIAGLVDDKYTDPAVVVLDEGGHYAISLLSGHEGGANALAYAVSRVFGAIAVVSTATEATKPLIAGVGCRKGVTDLQIEQCLLLALGERRIEEVRLLATIDIKENEPGLLAFCKRMNLPLQIFSRESVAARAWSSKPSKWVKKNIGVVGVCEPCALMVSSRGQLVVEKTTLNGVAVALVEDSMRLQP